jgi:hypothetical protein
VFCGGGIVDRRVLDAHCRFVNSDGQKVNYLTDSDTYRHYDPPLFDFLATQVATGARNVRHLEASDIVPKTRYYSRFLDDSRPARSSYIAAALNGLAQSDLLFFDPDNGLEVRSVRLGSVGSSKYLYWHEVEQAWATGASLLLFQHFNREPRDRFVIDYARNWRRGRTQTISR